MSNQGDYDDMDEDWSNVTDPHEKRKMQLRNAQRRYRRNRKEREEIDRMTKENEKHAASAYSSTLLTTDETESRGKTTGPPWGNIPIEQGIRINSRNLSDPSSPQAEASNANTSEWTGEQADTTASREVEDESSTKSSKKE